MKEKERFKEVVFIKEEKLKKLNYLLSLEEEDIERLGYDKDGIIEVFTACFSDGIQADIKVCSGTHNFFIDPVLFNKNGGQMMVLDTEDDLLGEYVFKCEDAIYVVDIQLDESQVEKEFCLICEQPNPVDNPVCQCGSQAFAFGNGISIKDGVIYCRCQNTHFEKRIHIDYVKFSEDRYSCPQCFNAIGVQIPRSESCI